MNSGPKYATGKICYIEIPASDVDRSAEFYQTVFGWNVRKRDDGSIGFDDTVNEVSGRWVTDRPASTTPGVTVHIMVADAASTVQKIVAAGGTIVQPFDPGAREVYGLFADPHGNVFGFYQENALRNSHE